MYIILPDVSLPDICIIMIVMVLLRSKFQLTVCVCRSYTVFSFEIFRKLSLYSVILGTRTKV